MTLFWLLVGLFAVVSTWAIATHRATTQLRRANARVSSGVSQTRAAQTPANILSVSKRDPEDTDDSEGPNVSAVVREALLELRNEELRLILDTVDQGFVTAQPDGLLMPERSAILRSWSGPLPPRVYIWDLVEKLDASAGGWMRLAWSQIFEGQMPEDVAIAQLPRRLTRGHQHWELSYHPVQKLGAIVRIVVVVTDVSLEVERQRAVAEQHDFSALVERFVSSRQAFLQVWSEMSVLVQQATRPDAQGSELLRALHTLKGSLRFVGVSGVADICHALEDGLQERPEQQLKEADAARLREAWATLESRMTPLLKGAQGTVQVTEREYERLRAAQHAPPAQLASAVRDFFAQPARDRLQEAKDYLVGVCTKLGKTPPVVELADHEVRLDPTRFAHFWTVFVHVLNNTADHGIEADAERTAAGKKLPARVKLQTTANNGRLAVEVIDDGPGIDWQRLADGARAQGLPHETHEQLVRALFSDSVSSKHTVTEFSGRGVGLAAVAEAVRELGGELQVESGRAGTTLRMVLPL